MKNHYNFNRSCFLALLVAVFVLASCQKTALDDQSFDDVFNTTQIQALNNLVENSATLDDLPEEFSLAEITIPEAVATLQLTDLVSYLEQKVAISDLEVDLLLQNDIDTYSQVVERLGSLPAQLEEMNLNSSELKNSPLKKYQLIQVQELNEYYTSDYYHAALELQSYVKKNVILSLRNLNRLAENTLAQKSATIGQSNNKNQKSVQAIVVSIINDLKELLKKIKEDCEKKKKEKHKGSKGHNNH